MNWSRRCFYGLLLHLILGPSAVIVVVAKASACRLGKLAVLVIAKEAYDSVYDCTDRADDWEEDPSSEIQTDC